MTLNLHLPVQHASFRPTITVIGVGGAGGNAVNNMINAKLEGVQFIVANTDAQALETALTERTIQLGSNITQGLGAGASPEVGRAAAEEALEEILGSIEGSHMVFVTAGMGGGTGTGAAPVIAKMARERGILAVAVVTKPFQFEGAKRMRIAEEGLRELQQYVDTLIVIPNQNLFRIANEKTTFADAFRMADEVLHSGVRGVTDLMVKPGLVNLDFADIRTVMREMGKAMMGTGEATGDKRAVHAAEAAISNPLLDDVSLKGARAALINITGGPDMTLFEVDEAANRIREEIDPEANIIFGSTYHESMEGMIRVSVVATGIDAEAMRSQKDEHKVTLVKKPYSAPATATAGSTFAPRREPAQSYAAPKPASLPQARPAAAAPTYVTAEPKKQEMKIEQRSFLASRQSSAEAAQRQEELEEPVEYEMFGSESEPFISPRDSGHARGQDAVEDEYDSEEETLFWKPKDGKQAVEQSGGGSFSFLKKIAEVGHALSHKAEVDTPAPTAAPRNLRVEVAERKADMPVSADKEDYYDIPAFLRRQAN